VRCDRPDPPTPTPTTPPPKVHASLAKLLHMSDEEVDALGLTFEVGGVGGGGVRVEFEALL